MRGPDGILGRMTTLDPGSAVPAWPRWVAQPTSDDDGAGPVWVAADESGSTGENLVDPRNVFAHATVRIDDETAGTVLAELRAKAGATQSPEVKFTQFTRKRGLAALGEALAPGGRLADLVNIAVGDKRFIATGKLIDLLVEERAHELGKDIHADGSALAMARTLFRDGPRALGEQWEPLIASFVSLARATQRQGGDKETVASFFSRLEAAHKRSHRRSVDAVLSELLDTRHHADQLVRRNEEKDFTLPALDPLLALLPISIRHWYRDLGAVRFLHDEQKVFTPEVVKAFLWGLENQYTSLDGSSLRSRVDEFCLGSSKVHPSIQLADLAASSGRVVIESHLGAASLPADALREAVLPLIRPPWLLADDDIGRP